jgi:hypothetical protein
MFLVHFPCFLVDRRVNDFSLKLYLRPIERRSTKFEVNVDLCSLKGCFCWSIKDDIPVKRVIVNTIDHYTIDGFVGQEIKLLLAIDSQRFFLIF